MGELTSSVEKPAGTDAVTVTVGVALGLAEGPAVLGLGEGVAVADPVESDDWVGIGLGGESSEHPASASATRDSTATVLAVRELPMSTSCSRP